MPNLQAMPETMSSIELLEIINQSRVDFGESSIRNNDFLKRAKDELEGDGYESFVTVPEGGGTPMEALRLTQDQCMLIAMRESKGVRRKVLDKLKNRSLNKDQSIPSLPSPSLSDLTRFVELTLGALPNLGESAKQCLLSKASEIAFGQPLIPLPTVTEHLMTATEVGEQLGISANKVGRLANLHGLKTAEFGEVRLDKSRHSSKQVESFVYRPAAVDQLRGILSSPA